MKKNSILNLIMVIISFSLFFIIFELFLYIDNHSADYKKFIYKINNINYTFNDNPIDSDLKLYPGSKNGFNVKDSFTLYCFKWESILASKIFKI